MSTAKFDTLSNLAGTQTVPVATVAQGSAKAWVNFNGTGTVAIRASFNVSSITDNAVGAYTANLTAALPDTNAAVSALTGNTASGKAVASALVLASTSTVRVEISPGLAGAGLEDSALVTIAVFR